PACPIVFRNKPAAKLQRYKNAHSTHIITPATTIKTATVPDTEIQGSAVPVRTHVHYAQTVATHDTSTAQAGTEMRRDGQTIARDARRQRKSTIYFDQRSCFVNTGEKGLVADMGFVYLRQ
ncbi:hypothetical protein LB503_010506, partial [Fusarium chuoi]